MTNTLDDIFGHTPKVLNHKTDEIPEDAIWIMRPGPYGNPFIIGIDGNREECLALFINYAETTPGYKEMIRKELHGKDLVCCCKPKDCHGDYLLLMAN